jgi:hypothetical protein
MRNVIDNGCVDWCGKNQMTIATPYSVVKKELASSSEIAGSISTLPAQSQKRLEECMPRTIRTTELNDVLFSATEEISTCPQPISLSILFLHCHHKLLYRFFINVMTLNFLSFFSAINSYEYLFDDANFTLNFVCQVQDIVKHKHLLARTYKRVCRKNKYAEKPEPSGCCKNFYGLINAMRNGHVNRWPRYNFIARP